MDASLTSAQIASWLPLNWHLISAVYPRYVKDGPLTYLLALRLVSVTSSASLGPDWREVKHSMSSVGAASGS